MDKPGATRLFLCDFSSNAGWGLLAQQQIGRQHGTAFLPAIPVAPPDEISVDTAVTINRALRLGNK